MGTQTCRLLADPPGCYPSVSPPEWGNDAGLTATDRNEAVPCSSAPGPSPAILEPETDGRMHCGRGVRSHAALVSILPFFWLGNVLHAEHRGRQREGLDRAGRGPVQGEDLNLAPCTFLPAPRPAVETQTGHQAQPPGRGQSSEPAFPVTCPKFLLILRLGIGKSVPSPAPTHRAVPEGHSSPAAMATD